MEQPVAFILNPDQEITLEEQQGERQGHDLVDQADKGAEILLIACGALAQEVIDIRERLKLEALMDITCLPAILHNRPAKIAPLLAEKINKAKGKYRQILIGYADCGSGGDIDRVIKDASIDGYPISRLEGAHCYAFYAGQSQFEALSDAELGTFYLTDYLARFFDNLIIKGLGLDRFPQLKEQIFANYKKLVYLAQTDNADLDQKASDAAKALGLDYERIFTEYGELQQFIHQIKPKS